MKRLLTTAIAGGLAIMVWNSFSHMILHLGDMGIDVLPDEQVVVSTLKSTVTEPGFYFFPGIDMSGNVTEEAQSVWEENYRTGPTGVLVYRPAGGEPVPVRSLTKELVSNILAALLAAWIISLIPGTYWRRVAVVTVIGLIAWLTISASNWIWWGFPAAFIAAEGIETIVGWFLAGLAMAAIVRSTSTENRSLTV